MSDMLESAGGFPCEFSRGLLKYVSYLLVAPVLR